jgi:MoxR-like ATPase
VEIVVATRKLGDYVAEWQGMVQAGASPRASIALLRAASARAFLERRDYVLPEDVIALAPDVLRHRLVLDFAAEADAVSADDIVHRLIAAVPSP